MAYPKKLYLAALAAFACPGWTAAQSMAPDEMHARTVPYAPPSAVTLRTEVTVVEVPVVVRDGQHRAVGDLTKDNFEILDAGKKQSIAAFSVQRFTLGSGAGVVKPSTAEAAAGGAASKGEPQPRFVALCFDDLNIDQAALKQAKAAAEQFVRTSLAPGDRVAIATTALSGDSAFIEDAEKLVEQIEKVTVHRRFSDADSAMQCPRIRPYEAYLIVNRMDNEVLQAKVAELQSCSRASRPEQQVTAMAQAIWEHALFNSKNTLRVIDGLVGGMAKLAGQRMILLTSGGFLTGNLETDEDSLIAKALHAGVVIDTLDARGLYTVSPGGDASEGPPTGRIPRRAQPVEARAEGRQAQAKDDGMAVLAAGTGGAFYHNSNDLARGFRELGMVPETLYVLSFTPSGGAADGRFHSLKVRLTGSKKYSVQARLGYTAPSANAPAPAPPPTRLDSEALASDILTDLPASFTWEQRAGPPSITIVGRLDIGRLHFDNKKDRRQQKLTLVGVLLDAQGRVVAGKRSELELNFTEATFARLAKTGAAVSMTLEAPPGNYTVRAVAQDALDGKLAATGGAAEIK